MKMAKLFAIALLACVGTWVFLKNPSELSEKGSTTNHNNRNQNPAEIHVSENKFSKSNESNGSTSGIQRVTHLDRINFNGEPYYDLKLKSEKGDGISSFKMYKLIRICLQTPVDEAAFDDFSNDAYISKKIDGLPVSNIEAEIDARRKAFDICRGLPDRSESSAYNALKMAADAGVLEALVETMNFPPPIVNQEGTDDYKREIAEQREIIMKYIELATAKGSAEAYYWSGEAYLHGVMTPKDSFRAYVNLKVSGSVFSEGRRKNGINKLIELASRDLSPTLIEEGDTAVEQILKGSKCCTVFKDHH